MSRHFKNKISRFSHGILGSNFTSACKNIALITAVIATIVSVQIIASSDAAAAARLVLRTSQEIYVPRETLVIFGAADPNDLLATTVFDPSGLAIRISSVEVDQDGFFRSAVFTWPEASRNIVFGTYSVEVRSSLNATQSQRVEVTFAEGIHAGVGPQFPTTHALEVKLDAPSQVAVNEMFRIFIQVTYDGALVHSLNDTAVKSLLGSSHIHSTNSTIILSDKVRELHPGLYFADVSLGTPDTYIIHSAAFHKGSLSHDSRVIGATISSIGTIQESVNELDSRLETANRELELLQNTLGQTQGALNDTKAAITQSVDAAQKSIGNEIGNIQQASGQINSLILPVLALISIIIALQISLFARIRASYR